MTFNAYKVDALINLKKELYGNLKCIWKIEIFSLGAWKFWLKLHLSGEGQGKVHNKKSIQEFINPVKDESF